MKVVVATYSEMEKRFGNDKDPEISDMVSKAFALKTRALDKSRGK